MADNPALYFNSKSVGNGITLKYIADEDDVDPHRVWTISVNKQDGRIAFGGAGPNARVWNRSTDTIQTYEGDVGEIWALEWSSKGHLAAICWPPYFNRKTETARPKTANNLVVWDQQGKLIAGPIPIHAGFGIGLSWHPDGTRVATAATDGVIRIWEPCSRSRKTSEDDLSDSWLKSGESEDDEQFTSANLKLVAEILMPEAHQFLERSELRYSPDGSRLATANRNALFILDPESGEVLVKMDELGGDFKSIDWSPNGELLAAGTGYKTTVWDTTSGRLAIQIGVGVYQVRWAPDGRRLGIGVAPDLIILDATRGYELENASETER